MPFALVIRAASLDCAGLVAVVNWINRLAVINFRWINFIALGLGLHDTSRANNFYRVHQLVVREAENEKPEYLPIFACWPLIDLAVFLRFTL